VNYLIHEDKMEELNTIIGKQGSPGTSKVSDSFAALEIAIKSGVKADAQKAFDAAVQANIAVGKAWENAQQWHDKRINEDQYEGGAVPGESGGDNTGPPAIPSNATEMFRGGDGHLQTADGKDITVYGHNYAAHVTGAAQGDGSKTPWQWFTAEMDGNHVSMSCDSHQIAFTVTDKPTDPGVPGFSNTAMVMPYKKGQIVNFRIGAGGYHTAATAIFSVN